MAGSSSCSLSESLFPLSLGGEEHTLSQAGLPKVGVQKKCCERKRKKNCERGASAASLFCMCVLCACDVFLTKHREVFFFRSVRKNVHDENERGQAPLGEKFVK